jgi:hypothetical protein
MSDNFNIQVNDYEMGVDDTDMSIPVLKTDEGFYQMKETEMENPFFVSLTDKVDFEDTENKKQNHVFVVCMRDNFNKSDDLNILYERIVDKDKFKSVCKEIAIIKASSHLLYNNEFKSIVKKTNGKSLEFIFGNQYNFDTEELLLTMFELQESTVRMNNSLYDSLYQIDDLLTMVQLTSKYNRTYKRPVIEQFVKFLFEFECTKFWTKEDNCSLINMTKIFTERTFDYKSKKKELFKNSFKDMKEGEKEKVKTIFNSNKKNNNVHFDYLQNLEKNDDNDEKHEEKQEEKVEENRTAATTEFYDIFSAIQRNKQLTGKRTYYINNNLTVDQKYVNEVFSYLTDEEELFNVLNMLLVSKDYCHMIFNQTIMNKIKPIMEKNMPLYKYLFGYTWLSLITDESIMKTKATINDRFIFDIDTASKLPYFPTLFEDLNQNPYLCLPVDSKTLNTNKNVMSYPCLVNGENHYGVCTLEQFKRRMNLFLSGKSDLFPLKNIDWKHFAISGSAMPACLQKKSPLFNVLKTEGKSEDELWNEFFDHYYGNSDVDLICCANDIYDYLDKANTVINSLEESLGKDTTEVEHTKSMATHVTKQFFIERVGNFNEKFGTEYTPEQMSNLLDQKETNELHEYLFEIYTTHKFQLNAKIRKERGNTNKLLKYLMEPNSMKDLNINVTTFDTFKHNTQQEENVICFYINDFRSKDNQVPEDKNVMLLRFSENLKFKIRNKLLRHPIELFKTGRDDFFGIVNRFHLPCVRAYYNSENVYLTSSCITSMMTGINMDYKYFAGTRDPVDIINKYRSRGFSTLFSISELEHFKEYNTSITTFNKMYFSENGNELLGPKDLTNKIYRPKHYVDGIPEDLIYNNPNISYINNIEDLKKQYENKHGYKASQKLNMFDYKVIGDDGTVQNFDSWVPKLYWKLNHKK